MRQGIPLNFMPQKEIGGDMEIVRDPDQCAVIGFAGSLNIIAQRRESDGKLRGKLLLRQVVLL